MDSSLFCDVHVYSHIYGSIQIPCLGDGKALVQLYRWEAKAPTVRPLDFLSIDIGTFLLNVEK